MRLFRAAPVCLSLRAAARCPSRWGGYMPTIEIPARKGKAARLRKDQTVKVINTKGQQVVDTWAFNAEDLREFMSMEHSRVSIGGIIPKIGSVFVTNRR